MSKLNRFIQFNDETVDARTFLLYERLAKALADAPFLKLHERKLAEFQPQEGTIAISVFWRHRPQTEMHLGRLSDIYLLTAGFWEEFSLQTWQSHTNFYRTDPLEKLAGELLLMLEEFRISENIQHLRPGTKQAFSVRIATYTKFHRDRLYATSSKGFFADALLHQLYLFLYEGMYTKRDAVLDSLVDLDRIAAIWQFAYDTHSTSDQLPIVHQIIDLVRSGITSDVIESFYAIGNSLIESDKPFHYHEGMGNAEQGEPDEKETIEEVFRTWHRESKEESGVHLQYELEHGRSGIADGTESQPGNEDAEITQIGTGASEGNERSSKTEENRDDTKKGGTGIQKAGANFGNANKYVSYEAKRMETIYDPATRVTLEEWRTEQKPFVQAFIREIKKRIEAKQEERHERLMHGRLSNQLTTLFLDERPKPFYRKNKPGEQLDAVFGLLVDGSASMIDKLDETKKAVLLFHDVLRSLQITHEMTLYYEDAFEASANMQPNYFEWMHTFEDRSKDSGASILSMEAHEDNRDGFAIRWLAGRMAARPEKHKFMLVFSDGEPSAFGYAQNGIIDTAEAVMEAEKSGISVLHLFLSAEEPTDDQKQLFAKMFGHKTASSSSVDAFADQTLRILRKLLRIVTQ